MDGGGFVEDVVAIAGVGPVLGGGDEAADDRVGVYVVELFDELVVGEDVEVVVAGLPELGAGALEEFGGFAFEGSERVVQSVELWFAEKHVDVLGHEDVAVAINLVASTEGFESVQEDGSGVVVVEVGKTVVTTEGEEMEMAFGLVSLQTTRHGISLSFKPRVGM